MKLSVEKGYYDLRTTMCGKKVHVFTSDYNTQAITEIKRENDKQS